VLVNTQSRWARPGSARAAWVLIPCRMPMALEAVITAPQHSGLACVAWLVLYRSLVRLVNHEYLASGSGLGIATVVSNTPIQQRSILW